MVSFPIKDTQEIDPKVLFDKNPGIIEDLAKWDRANEKYIYYKGDANHPGEPNNSLLKIKNGEGYWLKLKDTYTSAEINLPSEKFSGNEKRIELKTGWNQIGVPFDSNDIFWRYHCYIEYNRETLNIENAANRGLVYNYAWTYWTYPDLDGKWKSFFKLVHHEIADADKRLYAYKSYFVYAKKDCTLLIKNPSGKFKIHNPHFQVSDENWQISIKASAGDFIDSSNFVGVSNEPDKLKVLDPPAFEQSKLSLYFLKSNLKYATDFKYPSEDRYIFDFVIETDIQNTDVIVNLDTSNLPEGYRVKLIDLSREYGVGSNEYIYNSGDGGVRKFKLIVEKPLIDTQEKALSLEYTYSYPNPYSGKRTELTPAGKLRYTADSLTFRYKATGDIKKVVIEIYNIKGKLIERFEDTTIDGEANYDFAEKLANGVYIYRITISDVNNNKKSKTGKLVILK
jgi:hypothetical protein